MDGAVSKPGVCVEGWDVIGSFGGARISSLLAAAGADTRARFLAFSCADDYYESLDMATALHPQSLLCYEMYGVPLERGHGAPLRLILPTKIGYKSAKYLTSLTVTSVLDRRGYWRIRATPGSTACETVMKRAALSPEIVSFPTSPDEPTVRAAYEHPWVIRGPHRQWPADLHGISELRTEDPARQFGEHP